MTRQIALGYGAPSRADLENRIHALEVKVVGLTEAVTLLARALEHGPSAGAGPDAAVANAARQAHELVIARRHSAETRTETGEAGHPAGL
ncbi:MAG TPA: hypothetical protein VE465_24210 [Streptosporangiaceae bacterium]|jgi:hypothetical protein|nr:hypothetical protein [Streptosporangiaceae bacterium]